MIIPVYKPLGASSHQLAAAVGRARNEKATHTGTLDPMAEGVLVVLTGEDRFRKHELSNTKKVYTFSFVLGISTDSHDMLGLTTNHDFITDTYHERIQSIQKILPKLIGKYKQEQPIFSAGRKNGKSLFDYGKEGKTSVLPQNDVVVYDLTILSTEEKSTLKLSEEITKSIHKVSGNFRQAEVLASWQKTWQKLAANGITKLTCINCSATVSKRCYIRGLVRDIASISNLPATTIKLVRTKNGPFTLQDCQTIP